MSTGFVLNIPQEMIDRLDLADQKIEKLAKTSEDAQVRIVSAFKSMSTNGVDAFFQSLDVAQQKLAQLGGTQINMGVNANTSGFQQLIDAINNLSQASKTNITINGLGTVGNQTQTAIDAINKLMATLQQLQQMGGQQFLGGVNSLGRQTLREMNKEAKKMQKTMQDLDDAIQKYGISATDLANKLQQARQAQQQFNDAAKQQAQADVSGLIGMKGQQTTLNELKNYANELKRTMANLDPKSQEWAKLNNIYKQTNKEIKNIQNSMKDVQKQSRNLMDISGQLARRLALVFSVSQITGYVKKLIEVRGEFELQQRSLQAILQNKDEANRIWQQTVDLAVRSPFRVKELVNYTKQLAAYRIESDKLFETNKMLADISAGLGVDMQRLILAFGQVRSAAYLRGTELRQFTEAGIPILEQLAQYFTELEGRAVSVGDVFERVSKRMVSFADVEEIFRRMTSEGGTFFKMQEIQAGTLKGLWSNLKDSVDIMLNEIGKDSESMLKKSLVFVKRLVDNWSELKPIIESAGITFFAYFGTKALKKIVKGFKTLTTLMSANPYLTAAAAATVLLTTLLQVAKAQDELNAAMSEIENENKKALEENIGLYLKLAETINDATKSTQERDKALENLRENFKDILPDQYLELEYIRSISDNYDAATDAMINYYNAKTIQQKKDKIESEFSEELEGTNIPELTDAIKALIVSSDEIGDKAKTKLVAGVSYAVNGVVEEVKSGKLDPSFNAIKEAIEEKLLAYSGEDFDLTPFMDKLWISPLLHTEEMLVKKNLGDIMQTLIEYRYRMGDIITGLQLGDTFEEDLAGNAIAEYKEYVNELESAANKLFNLADGFSKQPVGRDATDLILDIVGDLNIPDHFKSQFEPLLLSYANELFLGAKGGEFEFKSLSSSLQERWKASIALVWSGLAKQAADSNKEGAKELADLMWEEMDKAIEESAGLGLSDFQIEVDKVFREAAKELSVTDLNIFKDFIPDSKKSRTALIKDLNTTVEQYKQNIEEWEQIINKGGSIGAATILTQFSEEAINRMRIAIPLLTLTAEKLGYVNKQTSPDRNKGIEARISVIKQLNSKYKELNNTLSDTESLEGAFAAYKDAFATAYGREDVRKMTAEEFAKNVLNFPDEDAIVAWLDNLAKTVKGKENKLKAELAKGEFEMDVKARLKEEEDKELLDDIQKLFDQYDLSLELKKLNIPPDLAKSLFDVDYLDLDGLKKAVQEQEAKFIGTDMEKDYKDLLDKIDDMENKAAKERMKTYVKYLMEGMSERVKLKIEELRKLKEIEESSEFSPEQKERIKEGVSKEARVEQQKQEWKDFQGSDMYTMMFEDLEHYGSAAIDMLYTKLSELKTSLSDLPASEVKEIIGQIEKLENIQIERNPFEYLKKYKEEVKNIGFTEGELQTQLLDSQKAEEEAQKYIDIYNTVMQSLMSEDEGVFEEIDAETLSQWNQMLRLAEEQGKTVEEILADRKATVKTEQDNQGKIVKNLNSYKKLSKAQKESLELTQEWLTQVGNLFSSSKDLMESLGVESDSVAMTIADTGSSMVSLIGSAIQFTLQLDLMGVAANSALGVIGWIAIALQAVATVLSAIFSAKDKALQKEIDGHLARAEKLHEKYEELSDAIDSAYDASVVRQFNKEIEKTIQLEIKAIEAAIAAEKSQKDSKIDWGWVDEQEKKVKELYNTLNEEHDNYIARWGGFGSDDARLDFIESMTQAWLDSFKETGDGLAGLEEKWDEYFDNLALKQMTLRVSKAAIDKYLDMWDKYVSAESAGGEDLTEAEAQDLRLKKEQLLKDLSERYTNLAESLGITPTTEGGGLSALQKGIQGITSDQAEILSAYWNSVRGYTASIDSKLDVLLASVGGGSEENPMLEQMRLVAKNTSAINTLLNSLVKGGHPQGGQGLKVFMD